MLKRTMTYKDLDGNEVTDDFYFALSVREIAKMEIANEGAGGYGEMLKAMVKSGNGELIMETFEKFIRDAYGKRHEDGKRFVKSPDISDEFMQTGAFDQLFLELVLNPKSAEEFILAIMPADMQEQAAKIRAAAEAQGISVDDVDEGERVYNPDADWTDYDGDELLAMPAEHFDRLFKKVGTNKPKGLLTIAARRKDNVRAS
jgi:hypothetical protein